MRDDKVDVRVPRLVIRPLMLVHGGKHRLVLQTLRGGGGGGQRSQLAQLMDDVGFGVFLKPYTFF